MNFPVSNPGLRVLSLLLAVALWYIVVSQGSSEISLEVPLTFKNIPDLHEIVWESDETVTVRVSGQEQRLKRIGPGSVSVYIDLADGKAGEATYVLTPEQVRVPGNVAVTKITPSEVRLRLEELERKMVRVDPVIAGRPAPGTRVGIVDVDPGRVEATGVKSFLSAVTSVTTMPVDVTGWPAGEKSVTVQIDSTGKSYRVDPAKVDVRIRIIGKEELKP